MQAMSWWLRLVLLIAVSGIVVGTQTIGTGKRGQLSGRYKGRKDFKPITGTYPSVEAKEYYTNPMVSSLYAYTTKSQHSFIRAL